jgi:hypothetical protein
MVLTTWKELKWQKKKNAYVHCANRQWYLQTSGCSAQAKHVAKILTGKQKHLRPAD